MQIRAITLDLDDTVWPITPVMVRAERVLADWLRANAPRTAERWPLERMREMRDAVNREHPDLAHDFTRQRLIALERMFEDAGDDVSLAQPAFDAFFAARCEVEHYADSLEALDRLAARVPLAALSNGNADLSRIGLMHVFRFQLGAREHGHAKPDPSIFHAACERLGVPPAEVLHVGDDIEMDVLGAHRAGIGVAIGIRMMFLAGANAAYTSSGQLPTSSSVPSCLSGPFERTSNLLGFFCPGIT